MRLHRLACLLTIIALVSGSMARAAVPAPFAKISAGMQQFVEQQKVAGVVWSVGRHGGVLATDAVGWRNLEKREPMTADTLFRIASMTKPVTAVAVMMLVDEGKLAIEDPVEKHLPEFKGQMLLAGRSGDTVTLKKPPRPITLRDLLTHTSGLPSRPPEGLADLYMKRNHTLAEIIMAQSQRPLEFEPGSKWSYCNLGIDTLGRIVEVASGQSYESFVQKRIFDPLGMRDTTFYPTAAHLPRVAPLYEAKDGKLAFTPGTLIGNPGDAKYPIPAGGLFSTAADLARLYQMFLNRGKLDGRQYLADSSFAAMTRVQTGELAAGFVPGMGFGLGVGIVRQPQGVTAMLSPGTFGHGGAFGTQGWIDLKQDLFFIMLIARVGLPNGDGSEMRATFQTLAVEAAH